MLLPRIDLFVTTRCNNKCPVCLIPFCRELKDPSLNDIKILIDKLVEVGLKKICITGGEPIMRNDIDEILRYIYGKGVKIYLFTNGHFLLKKYDSIAPYLGWLSLSLDGVEPLTVQKIKRDKIQPKIIGNILEFFNRNTPSFGVTINTIVSKQNIYEISKIGEFLTKRKYIPDQWRLIQYLYWGPRQNEEVRKENMIDLATFNSVCRNLKQKFSNFLRIDIYPLKKKTGVNVLIGPNFHTFVNVNGQYKSFESIQTLTTNQIEKFFYTLFSQRILKNRSLYNWPRR